MERLKRIFLRGTKHKKRCKADAGAPSNEGPHEGLDGLAGLLFHEVPVGLILLGPQLEVKGINAACRHLLQLRQDESFFLGRPLMELLRIPELAGGGPRQGPLQRGRFAFTTHTGTQVEIEILSKGGHTLVILQEAETEDDELKALAEATHHLRTPLTSIRGYAETLLEQPHIPQEKRQEFLGLILKNTEILTEIVKNIMFLSRLKSGAHSKNFSEFDVLGLVEDLACLFENVEVSQPTKGAFTGYGDPDLTRMALYSLVENAVQYGGNRQPVSIRLTREGGAILITVRDHGPGIPLEAQAHIFRKFFRAKETKGLHPQGTGLGLAIAKEIALLQGGDITVKSQWGKGTEMTLRLRTPPARSPRGTHI